MQDISKNQKPIQICFITEEFPKQNDLGGIGYHFLYLGKELAQRGHQVTVLYDGDRSFFIRSGVKSGMRAGVQVVGVWQRSNPLLRLLYQKLKNFELGKVALWSWQARSVVHRLEQDHTKFQLIETHDYHLMPWLLSLGTDRVVVSVHGGKKQTSLLNNEYHKLENRVIACAEQLSLKKAKHLYTVSPLQAKKIRQLSGVEVKTTIPNPVDTSFFVPVKKTKNRLPYILYVGRFEKRKGVLELLKAYTALVDASVRWTPPLPDLYCVGEDCAQFGQDQNLFLRELIEMFPAHVKKKIKLFPYVPQKKLLQLYQGALCCVCPSLEEPFGYVVAEAMSCGQLVIVSSKAGITHWLSSSKDSIVVPPTAKNLETVLRKIIHKPNAYTTLRKQARVTISKYFKPNIIANQIEKYYRSVLRQPGF